MKLTIRRFGNSAGVLLPAQMLRDKALEIGQEVIVQVEAALPPQHKWHLDETWPGADEDELMLEDIPAPYLEPYGSV